MSERMIVTASLEGMRVVVDGEQCELHEYNFQHNQWLPKEEARWPLSRPLADRWLTGWNDLDRFAAVSALTKPLDYPGELRDVVGRVSGPRL